MEILQLISQDHGIVKALFERLERRAAEPGPETESLVAELVTEILLHTKAEERALYRPLQTKGSSLKDFALEGHVEHKLLEIAVKRLSVVPPGADGKFKAVLKVAKELFVHHAVEEEEAEVFPKVRELFSPEEREALGERMATIKTELRKIKSTVVPGPAPASETARPITPEEAGSPSAAGAVPSRAPESIPAAVVPAPSAGKSREENLPGAAPQSEELRRAV